MAQGTAYYTFSLRAARAQYPHLPPLSNLRAFSRLFTIHRYTIQSIRGSHLRILQRSESRRSLARTASCHWLPSCPMFMDVSCVRTVLYPCNVTVLLGMFFVPVSLARKTVCAKITYYLSMTIVSVCIRFEAEEKKSRENAYKAFVIFTRT